MKLIKIGFLALIVFLIVPSVALAHPAELNVIKQVINDNGGTAVSSHFSLHVTSNGVDVSGSPAMGQADPGKTYILDPGTYEVTEDGNAGYTTTFTGDCDSSGSITLEIDEKKTCTVVNNDVAPDAKLHVVKHVVNDNGGTAVASDFSILVKLGGTEVSGSPAAGQEDPGIAYMLESGQYAVGEGAHVGYAKTISGDCDEWGNIVLAAGEEKTCTITNDDLAEPSTGSLAIIKEVINDNGGTAVAADFMLHVKDGGVDITNSPAVGRGAPGKIYQPINPGTYVVSEDANAGYDVAFSGDCDASGSVTIAAGDSKTCTVTNNDVGGGSGGGTATLHVIKHVINDHGKSAVASDFSLHVKLNGTEVAGSPSMGQGAPGTAYVLNPGTYVVSEDSTIHYTAIFSGDCDASGSVALAAGDSKTCTITNNDVLIAPPPTQGTLMVIKHVINDNGKTAVASDFSLHVKLAGTEVSGSPVTGQEAPGRMYFLDPGTYVVSEDSNPDYARTFSGDCDAAGNVTVVSSAIKTCTITNNDLGGGGGGGTATLHLIKHVVNDNDGTAAASNFSLHVKLSGTDVSGSPAMGQESPGTTYTLNSGTYQITEDGNTGYTTTFSGDCDGQGNIALATGEEKTCTVTNNDVEDDDGNGGGGGGGGGGGRRRGGGGGGSSSSQATPEIQIQKIPSVPYLAAGGTVSYSYFVTNPTNLDVTNVDVADDQCAPVVNTFGDTNGNGILESGELWIYTCQAPIFATTTNIATARGVVNGRTVLAQATATVLVGTPGFPDAGFPPSPAVHASSRPADTTVLAVALIFAALLAESFAAIKDRRRKTAVV